MVPEEGGVRVDRLHRRNGHRNVAAMATARMIQRSFRAMGRTNSMTKTAGIHGHRVGVDAASIPAVRGNTKYRPCPSVNAAA